MVGVRVPLVIEGRKGSLKNGDSLFTKRRGSGVQGAKKPLLKKNSRTALIKKNSRPIIKTFQVSIQLEGDPPPDLKKPQFTKRRSVAKIYLGGGPKPEGLEEPVAPVPRKSGVVRVARKEQDQEEERLCEQGLSNISLLADTFHTQALHLHNKFRARHRVQELRLDDKLSEKAQKYAEFLANTNTFEHRY